MSDAHSIATLLYFLTLGVGVAAWFEGVTRGERERGKKKKAA